MDRHQMQNDLIKKLGHEHFFVIDFITLCEDYPPNPWNDACLRNIYKAYLKIQECKNKLQ